MTYRRSNPSQLQWIRQVRNSLRENGYYYERRFSDKADGAAALVQAAESLGKIYLPPGTIRGFPFIKTNPSQTAPVWRPFDRHAPIRWHNDFSTRIGRPQLSFSWISREDPGGPIAGAWWVASVEAVLAKICQTRQGRCLVGELQKRSEPFGYRDAGGWRLFRMVTQSENGNFKLRFYGRALEDGALLRFGKIPDRTREIISRIEEAAHAVREVLPAETGSLLIVHNSLSLHDRSAQTVKGPRGTRRQALLCFVKQLHDPL